MCDCEDVLWLNKVFEHGPKWPCVTNDWCLNHEKPTNKKQKTKKVQQQGFFSSLLRVPLCYHERSTTKKEGCKGASCTLLEPACSEIHCRLWDWVKRVFDWCWQMTWSQRSSVQGSVPECDVCTETGWYSTGWYSNIVVCRRGGCVCVCEWCWYGDRVVF